MHSKELERLRQEERDRVWKDRGDRFWGAFLFTKDGKVKSTLLLYSFCLSIVYAAIYGAAYFLTLPVLNSLLEGSPTVLVNLVEAAVPTVLGTAVCSLTWLLVQEKRMMLAAYLWLAVLAAASLVAMLVILRADMASCLLFLQVFALFVPAPILLGCIVSALLYTRWKRGADAVKSGTLNRR